MKDDMKALRNTLGALGILLPALDLFFNLVFGGGFNPPYVLASISATHYSAAYILFEGLVFGVGLFLIHYRGYDIKDWWASTLAGAGAIALVLFPCGADAPVRNFMMLPMRVTEPVHFAGAGLFFAMLVFIIGFQFTKTSGAMSARKLARNRLYRICAFVMAASLIAGFLLNNFVKGFHYFVYAGESVALWAFGLAWLTKGGAILKDTEGK